MRRLAIASVLILHLGLLAACGPPSQPIAALAVRDGKPVGILATCPGDSAWFSVYENNSSGPSPVPGPHLSWTVSGTPVADVVEIPVLGQPPDGWQTHEAEDRPASEVGTAVDNEPLTELKPGVRYGVYSSSSNTKGIGIDFTTEDFTRIGPDEVLAPKGHYETQVVSQKSFLRKANDRLEC
ncbi:MAG TPA: hypothetical protein VK453_11210 [Micromonosporaceae bacterium]|nr:hypothetical protein [Micromonosporaceae bacterium]